MLLAVFIKNSDNKDVSIQKAKIDKSDGKSESSITFTHKEQQHIQFLTSELKLGINLSKNYLDT